MELFGVQIDTFWLVLAAAILLVVLLMSRYDSLINLAYRRKTEWVKVYDRRVYKRSRSIIRHFATNMTEEVLEVTFQRTDGTFFNLQMSEEDFKRCVPFSIGQLTYRGANFIHFAPEIPTHEIEKRFPDEGGKPQVMPNEKRI